MKNTSIELALLLATRKAAIAAKKLVGSRDKESIDLAAVSNFRESINSKDVPGITVIIGEGEKDEAPMLYNGEKLGMGEAQYDMAIDPIEGTDLAASGCENVLCVLAITERGMMQTRDEFYSKRLVVAKDLSQCTSIEADIEENIAAIAKERNKEISEVVVAMLKRNRHKSEMDAVISSGARLALIDHGDLAYGILAFLKKDIDILWGIGGTPETIILAAASKAIGGYMEIMPVINSKELVKDTGNTDARYSSRLKVDDLILDDSPLFIATAVTNSVLGLRGVYSSNSLYQTEHLVIHNKQLKKISHSDIK